MKLTLSKVPEICRLEVGHTLRIINLDRSTGEINVEIVGCRKSSEEKRLIAVVNAHMKKISMPKKGAKNGKG